MKKMIIFAIFAAFAAVSAAVAADTSKAPTEKELAKMAKNYPLKENHDGLACADCHTEKSLGKYYLVSTDNCLSCHSSREEVADRTAKEGSEDVNPHKSFHSGTKVECYECHREHKPSRNYCGNCHDTDLWMNPVP